MKFEGGGYPPRRPAQIEWQRSALACLNIDCRSQYRSYGGWPGPDCSENHRKSSKFRIFDDRAIRVICVICVIRVPAPVRRVCVIVTQVELRRRELLHMKFVRKAQPPALKFEGDGYPPRRPAQIEWQRCSMEIECASRRRSYGGWPGPEISKAIENHRKSVHLATVSFVSYVSFVCQPCASSVCHCDPSRVAAPRVTASEARPQSAATSFEI